MVIKFQNGVPLKRGYFLTFFFNIFSHQGKETKIPSAHISLRFIHVFAHPIDFFAFPILQNGEKNLSWNFYYWCFVYTNAKLVVICKTQTLNDGRWRLSSIQKQTNKQTNNHTNKQTKQQQQQNKTNKQQKNTAS